MASCPEFPASPDSVVDIVPCDYVVNAILAVCATTPVIGQPEFYHVNSGARNPLTFRGLYGLIREYFLEHPFEGGPRGAARLPQWQFPGAGSVERLLSTSERTHKLADRALSLAPRSDRTRKIAKDLDRFRTRLDFLRRYLGLYNEYAQSELHFVDDNTLALTNALDPEDVDSFAFDSATYDWPTYIKDVHCPSITAPVRRMDAIRRKRGNRPTTMKDLSKDSSGAQALAVFDLDGTIMSTNVIEQYLWARLPELPPGERVAEFGRVLRKVPSYIRADRRDRGDLPSGGLPALQGCGPRRVRGDRRHDAGAVHAQPALTGSGPADPRAPRRRTHHDPDHRRGPAADPPARAAVRHDRRRGSRGRPRRALHRVPDRAAAGRGVAAGLAAALCQSARHRSDQELRVRRLPLRPADAADRRQRGRGQPRHRADAGRDGQPVVDRGVEDQAKRPALDPAAVAATPQLDTTRRIMVHRR